MRRGDIIQVTVTRLRPTGEGAGRWENRTVYVWGALPGEIVEVEVLKKWGGHAMGVAREVLEASPHRVPAAEAHYLSCSPWQIMARDEERRVKTDIARNLYIEHGGLPEDLALEIVDPEEQSLGYRNKIEYSFTLDDDGRLSFAFFHRGTRSRFPIQPCKLAEPAINAAGERLLAWLQEEEATTRLLKALVIRSNGKGQAIAALFIRDRHQFNRYPELDDAFLGFQIYYSNPQTMFARPDEQLYSAGQDYLIADVAGVSLKFGLLSFFQVNIPIFEHALADIGSFLDPAHSAVDFYAGVGGVSLPLHGKYKDCVLVESNEEAVQYARENIATNNLTNCSAELSPAEKMTDVLQPEQIAIFDPPRAGLHPDVVERLLEVRPSRLIYLSCNPESQATNIGQLREAYDVSFLRLYNFFPHTPHIEGLCVLERK